MKNLIKLTIGAYYALVMLCIANGVVLGVAIGRAWAGEVTIKVPDTFTATMQNTGIAFERCVGAVAAKIDTPTCAAVSNLLHELANLQTTPVPGPAPAATSSPTPSPTPNVAAASPEPSPTPAGAGGPRLIGPLAPPEAEKKTSDDADRTR